MEESDRHKSVLDEFTADGINIEDVQYLTLRENLESDAQDFEAPTWSLAVDPEYVKNFSKEAVKRQDVIHELIQTEINHVRTLKLMVFVYLRELRDSLLMDESQLERLFPRLDCLLQEHQDFLQRLKNRRRECLETGSDKNYFISNIGDVLITQFSDELRNRLENSYCVFCSRHTETGNLYKEQLQSNKKFQNLIRRIGQLSIMRRLGIPEGILLITQRITKYPVLVERIIKNTEGGTQEYADLVNALECIKDTISTVDTQVHQYEQLREIAAHLEPKSYGRMGNGKIVRREDLLQKDRRLLREGVLTWRPQNRSKALDIIVVLLPDLLLLLQAKDQKYIFASLDGKPAVLPLQKLIVREAAHSDRVLYLISASDVQADMYELHTSTAEERSSWRLKIWETIEKCPHMEEELMEHEDIYPNKLREVHDQLCEKDAQIEEILRQKLQIISDLSEVQTDNPTTLRRLLLKGSAAELQQGELLINNAIIQAENLQVQLIQGEMNFIPGESDDVKLHIKSQTLPAFNRMSKSGDGFRSRDQRPNSDPHLRDLYLNPLELSAHDEGFSTFPPPPPPAHTIKAEWIETADKLIRTLYSLKALVSQQDSELEVLRAAQSEHERSSRQRFSSIQDQERQRHLEKQREELLHLQKVHMQQQQEQESWARERQRHLLKMHELEQELTHRKEECTNKEAWLCAERDVLSRCRAEYQQDLERLRESAIAVEKEREKLQQESRRINKYKNITNAGASHLGGVSQLDNAHVPKLPIPYSSPDDMLSTRLQHSPSHVRPPLVPPRKESISVTASVKADVPIQLLSTTNESLKSSSIQQQIPTKLAISKGKDKNKSKSAHHRTNSAATIEFSEVFPIKVSGKEGGSLRAMKTTKLHTHTADVPLEHTLNSKPSQSVNASRKSAQLQNHQRTKNCNLEDVVFF
ncbi:rho guanine nucleotide exchange factor 18a [Tachysurus vachellii]|uniref:rho guanine nucleotide exchange factor 18a n=1 Tax=Tachysurus vachellii TaxID=175792 RepID=UPI00296B10B3|nr:rho guanine nucleotide exchange factor 18a [Tachysurus vachellii]XP_060729636.1 rho guanine nucleotide exchange factor 18a [Tachysurus vachellii]